MRTPQRDDTPPSPGAAETGPEPSLPSYGRVAAHLREQINDDRWADDEPLPTDLELSEEFGVSRQTVRRAYLDLVHDGLVYRVPGRGTFVSPERHAYHRPFETVDDLIGLSDDTELEILTPLAGGWDPKAGARLLLETRVLYVMTFLRRHHGNILCHTSVYLPTEIGSVVEDVPAFTQPGARTTDTVVGCLAERGITISGAEQAITARSADSSDAAALGCELGDPLLHTERLYIDSAGAPVEYAVSAFLPQHFSHRLHLGRRLTGRS